MSIPQNKALYESIRVDALKRYKSYHPLHVLSLIIKEYKFRGGTYMSISGPTQWHLEQWVMVIPFIKSGKVVECRSHIKDGKACRPLKRINDQTPVTLPELLKMYSKSQVLEMARKKNKNMKRRVDWVKLEFY